MKTGAIFFSLILWLVLAAGCLNGGQIREDPNVTLIFERYPELREKKVQIATIKRVVDGDTYEITSGQKVRLIGVNTPEIFGKSEHYGKEAAEFSRKRLVGRKIYLFKDVSETDRYNRLLRYIFVDNDPVMFNERLLGEGYANTMTVPPDTMFAEKFTTVERQAREKKTGLWGQPESSQTCENPTIKGNINSRNEKIYHVPGGKYYDVTIAEKLFCSEADAIAENFRKSQR